MERDPINGLVRGSYQIIHGPRGRGAGTQRAITVCHLGTTPSLQGWLVSDLRKHTSPTYLLSKTTRDGPDKIFGGSISSKNRHLMSKAHKRVLKTRDGFSLLNVRTTKKGPRQIAAKAGVVNRCQHPIRKPYGRQSGGIVALETGTTVQASPDTVSSGSASCLRSRNSASVSSDSGTKHIS